MRAYLILLHQICTHPWFQTYPPLILTWYTYSASDSLPAHSTLEEFMHSRFHTYSSLILNLVYIFRFRLTPSKTHAVDVYKV